MFCWSRTYTKSTFGGCCCELERALAYLRASAVTDHYFTLQCCWEEKGMCWVQVFSMKTECFQQILQLELHFSGFVMAKANSSCLVGAGQCFPTSETASMGLQKGTVESAAASVPDLCLNSEPLLSRALERSREGGGGVRDTAAMPGCTSAWAQCCQVLRPRCPWGQSVCFQPACPGQEHMWKHQAHSGGAVQPLGDGCAAALRFWCSHSDVQPIVGTHRVTKGGREQPPPQWPEREKLALWKESMQSPRDCIFTSKKILNSLIQS